MKQNFSVIAVFFIAFLALVGLSAQAQEESHDETTEELKELNAAHPELNLEEDKALINEPDHKSNMLNPPTNKESTGRASKPKETVKTDEDDALSFNFLYYIIQKFKISDIVDN